MPAILLAGCETPFHTHEITASPQIACAPAGSSLRFADSPHSTGNAGNPSTMAWRCHPIHPILCAFLDTIALTHFVATCLNIQYVCGGFCGRRPMLDSCCRLCWNAMGCVLLLCVQSQSRHSESLHNLFFSACTCQCLSH